MSSPGSRSDDFARARAALFDQARALDARVVAERLGGAFRGHARAAWARLKLCLLCEGVDCASVSAAGFRCHRCGAHGDGVALAAQARGESPGAAAAWLVGADVSAFLDARPNPPRRTLPPPRAARPPAERSAPVTQALAEHLRDTARANAAEVVTYLTARGVAPRVAARASARVLFHPAAPWSRDVSTPALVTPLTAPDAQLEAGRQGWLNPCGVHVTHLSADCAAKAALAPAKKMHGAQGAGGVPAGALVLAPPPGCARGGCDLVLAEGVETALALASLVEAQTGRPVAAFAALSLDRLQGGLAQSVGGGVDWRRPRPDPTRPAAGPAWPGRVLIGVDADCAPLRLHAGTKRARLVTPAERAQVAGLAAAFWARQRGAADVRVLTPPDGQDWADVALAHARAGGWGARA